MGPAMRGAWARARRCGGRSISTSSGGGGGDAAPTTTTTTTSWTQASKAISIEIDRERERERENWVVRNSCRGWGILQCGIGVRKGREGNQGRGGGQEVQRRNHLRHPTMAAQQHPHIPPSSAPQMSHPGAVMPLQMHYPQAQQQVRRVYCFLFFLFSKRISVFLRPFDPLLSRSLGLSVSLFLSLALSLARTISTQNRLAFVFPGALIVPTESLWYGFVMAVVSGIPCLGTPAASPDVDTSRVSFWVGSIWRNRFVDTVIVSVSDMGFAGSLRGGG